MQSELKREFALWMRGYFNEHEQQPSDVAREAFAAGWNRRAGSDAVPPGYKLVPIEPNEEMIQAVNNYPGACDTVKDILRAGIAAAPAPATEVCPKNFGHPHDYSLTSNGHCCYCGLDDEADQPERGELPELPDTPLSAPVWSKEGRSQIAYYTADQMQEYARQAVAKDRAKRSKKRFDLLSPETLEITRKASEAGEEVAMTPDGPVFINYGDREDRWAEQQAEYDATDWEAETIRLAARVQELEAQLAASTPAPVDAGAERERFEAWAKSKGRSVERSERIGFYRDPSVSLAHAAWKARAALATEGGDNSSRLAEAARELIAQGNVFEMKRYGEQFVCDVAEYEALRQALAQYEGKEQQRC